MSESKKRFQVAYYEGADMCPVRFDTDNALPTIKSKLRKKSVVGSATIFDRLELKIIYYKPMYHNRKNLNHVTNKPHTRTER